MLYTEAQSIVKCLIKYIGDLYVVGSFRRKEETINDIAFVTKVPLNLMSNKLAQYFDNPSLIVTAQSIRYMRMLMPCDFGDVYLDFWHADDPYEYFFMKTYLSLSKGHLNYYKMMAQLKNYDFCQYGLYKEGVQLDLVFLTKEGLNTKLGIPPYPYCPPQVYVISEVV
jgi:DNA polymerase/3'-5' exonuclease PolX